jgi:hypothetical protein
MTFADEVADVAVGLMDDPNFMMTATLFIDTSPKDEFDNKTAVSHTSTPINGFFSETAGPKTIDAEGTEPHATARFYTYDVSTAIKLKDKLVYGGNVYFISGISTPQIAETRMYRILELQLSEAKV